MANPILNDFARKYGRNLMAAAGAILALAWLPGVGIDQFKFFGLEFNTTSGSQFSFWALMAVVFAYFAGRYWVEARIDYLASYFVIKEHKQNLETERTKLRMAKVNQRGDMENPEKYERRISDMRPRTMEIRKFWIFDVGLPVVFALAAASTAVYLMIIHWPFNAPPP